MQRVLSYTAATLVALSSLQTVAQQHFQTKYYPFDNLSPAVQVDLNNDGIPDFIAQTRNFQVQELLSTGAGNYASKTMTVTGSSSGHPIAAGDFNLDGKADVIFWNPSGIAYGNGSGGFSSFTAIPWSGTSDYAMAQVADFNGDGKADLAVAYENSGVFKVLLFLNSGSGFASPKTIYTQSVPAGSSPGFEYITPLDLVLGDFDSDGHADLVVRTTESDPGNPANALVRLTSLYGNGAGSFTAQTIETSNSLYSISAADMNGDGTSDIVANYNPLRIYYGHTNRAFSVAAQAAANDRAIEPMLADFNGDQRKDIIYPALSSAAQDNIGISELLRTASGGWSQQGFYPNDTYNAQAGVVPYSQTFVGDYNHDCRPDVALIASANQVAHPNSLVVMLNEGVPQDGSCLSPTGIGIAVCSPAAAATVSSPVSFAFSANYRYPLRKLEVWIDGVKKSERYEVFSTVGYFNGSLSLSAGQHRVDLYGVAFDGRMLVHKTYTFTVN